MHVLRTGPVALPSPIHIVDPEQQTDGVHLGPKEDGDHSGHCIFPRGLLPAKALRTWKFLRWLACAPFVASIWRLDWALRPYEAAVTLYLSGQDQSLSVYSLADGSPTANFLEPAEAMPTPLPEPLIVPTTPLGIEADLVFSRVGSTDVKTYSEELSSFVFNYLQPEDSDPADPGSLLSTMNRFLHSKDAERRMGGSPWSIPRAVHQTSRDQGPPMDSDSFSSWRRLNKKEDGWVFNYSGDMKAVKWVKDRFTMAPPFPSLRKSIMLKKQLAGGVSTEDEDLEEEYVEQDVKSGEPVGGIVETFQRMGKEAMVMRSDFWRYLVLAVEGGVYSDIDTTCLRPVSDWWGGSNGELDGDGEEAAEEDNPSVVVGIEADVGDRHDWHVWYPRPVQISQWTMAAARGHPIMIDAVSRVIRANPPSDSPNASNIMDRTGPGLFTDAVLRYLGAKYGVKWSDLRGIGPEGRRWGDVLVLSITAFSPGVGHMGAQDELNRAALVKHSFAGSWKNP